MSVEKITARFYVQEVTRFAYSGGWAEPAPLVRTKLVVVSGGKSEENKKWASATPHGELNMTIGNPEAAAWIESMLGKDIAMTLEARDDVE